MNPAANDFSRYSTERGRKPDSEILWLDTADVIKELSPHLRAVK
jgi:hypothetical protein